MRSRPRHLPPPPGGRPRACSNGMCWDSTEWPALPPPASGRAALEPLLQRSQPRKRRRRGPQDLWMHAEEAAASTKTVAAVVAVAATGAAATAAVGDFALSCPSLIEWGAAQPATDKLDATATARQAEENHEADPKTASKRPPATATNAVTGLADDLLGLWGPIRLWADKPRTFPAANVPLHGRRRVPLAK